MTIDLRDRWSASLLRGVLRFAPDGRVRDFEEWANGPGKPYQADT